MRSGRIAARLERPAAAGYAARPHHGRDDGGRAAEPAAGQRDLDLAAARHRAQDARDAARQTAVSAAAAIRFLRDLPPNTGRC